MSRQLVIFVHGLGGHPQDTWGAFPSLLAADSDLKHFDVGYFSYPTSLFRFPFSRKAPQVETLAGALQTLIENRYPEYEHIVLVCHSLGGLIGKRYLIDQVEQSRNLRVKAMLLYAVPNNGAGLASVGNLVSWRHGQLRQLCQQSELVRTISTSWGRRQMADRLHVTYVVAGLDSVVDEFSARDSWGNVAVEVVVDRDHRNIVKPSLSSDLSYVILRNKLLKVAEPLRQKAADQQDGNQNSQSFGYASVLLTQPETRVSISALIRIASGDKYVLVRNLHRPESFAPIGGVYKFFREAQIQLDSLDFRAQVTEDEMVADLRGFLPSGNLEGLKKWFEDGHGRESAPECLQRELREELAQVGMSIALEELAGIRFSHVRTVTEGPEAIAAENYLQYRRLDIYDLNAKSLPAQNSGRARIRSEADRGKDITWATSQEIKRGRNRQRQVIGSHTPYLFGKARYRSHDPAFSD